MVCREPRTEETQTQEGTKASRREGAKARRPEGTKARRPEEKMATKNVGVFCDYHDSPYLPKNFPK